jgi:chromosome segregation ATPase
MLQIRELDHKMTNYREERNMRLDQIEEDRKELQFIEKEIQRLERDLNRTSDMLAVREQLVGSISQSVAMGVTDTHKLTSQAKKLLQRTNKTATLIERKENKAKAQEKPSRMLSKDTEMFLSRQRLADK